MSVVLRAGPTITLDPPYLVRKYGVTEEEFDRLTDEDLKAELFDGEMIVHSPATLRHDRVCTFLSFLLCGYADAKSLGTVFGANNAVMRLRPGRQFAPDVMVVRAGREQMVQGAKVEGAPDLVVEVLSPSTRRYDLEEKRKVYREAGIAEMWFVDEDRHRLVVEYRGRGGYREQVKQRGRVRSRVLAGFWLKVEWLWQDPLPNTLACLQEILAS